MVSQVVSTFGAEVKAKLTAPGVSGWSEDQLAGPVEALLKGLSVASGAPPGRCTVTNQAALKWLGVRPDLAVHDKGALVGFVELKAPGKGADPRKFTAKHDKDQWAKLQSLPNLLYTDGEAWGLWRDGKLVGSVLRFDSDPATAGAKLTAPPGFADLLKDFLTWSPIAPKTPKALAEVAARLCRLLRDEVLEGIKAKAGSLGDLEKEWRVLLFPQATHEEFADGYAQAVTFGLLMARAQGIPLDKDIGAAALALRQSNTLIGSALRLLTDDPGNVQALGTSLDTLARVLHEVDWATLAKGNPEAWLYFYEDFLDVYDRRLRKLTGSYYTPPEVVEAMVRLADEALRDPALFGRPLGLADKDVTVVDPATGTGTYLLGLLRRIAANVEADQGAGAVPGAVAAAASRLVGFELQFGPFAVAQLRLAAEMRALMGSGPKAPGSNLPSPRLHVTDTLGDPYAAQTQFSGMVAAIGQSREEANRIKREEPITVVIGNPPYKVDMAGEGGWIESGSKGRAAPMDLWTPPPAWGLGAHAKHLKNLYVFFWRWATWKAFRTDLTATTGEPPEDRGGLVCFITVSGFLQGAGFQRMREELRRDCSAIWVIDCSPEGHQPDVPTRIFQGVQHPVCIVLAARRQGKDRDLPAEVRFRAVPAGRREDKFAALAQVSLTGPGWVPAPKDWRAPLLPEHGAAWGSFPALPDLFVWSTPGVKTHRTWVISPDSGSLERRWERLQGEKDLSARRKLFHEDRDRTLDKVVRVSLGRHDLRSWSVETDIAGAVRPTRYAYRSFDRQWIIPDHRLLSQGRSDLWATESSTQIFLTALIDHPPGVGPALTLTSLIPDNDHFRGSFGGRVFPLWRDAAATVPNLRPALLAHLSNKLHRAVAAPDLLAYVAALLAQPAFSARFAADLRRPGLRVPLTASPALWDRAVEIGREVVWLHTYGERMADPAKGRVGSPRMPEGERPTIPSGGAIPGDRLPETMAHDPAARRLRVGAGVVERVPPAVWDYEVSGVRVLEKWFSYRRADRSRPIIGERRPPSALDRVQPTGWLPEYTTDLLDLLNVLGRVVALEPAQAKLLDDVLAGPLLTTDALLAAGALALPQGTGAATAAPAEQLGLDL